MARDGDSYTRAREALIREHQVFMNPETLRTAVDAVLEGKVTAEEAQRRYEAGRAETREQFTTLQAAAKTLEETRELITRALSWSGEPEWRDQVIERLDELIDRLQAPS